MNPLSLIPAPYQLLARIALAAAAILLVGFAVHAYNSHEQGIGEARVQAKWDAATQAQAKADAAESARRTAAQETSNHETAQAIAAAAADRDRASAVARQLRQRLTALSEQRRPDPAALPIGAPAGDPIGVLADVLSRADERAGILAAYADAARIAGQACERSYDALTPSPAP